ncbi:hypothetical protein ACQPW3_04350 [Actinosynnema sp. CA-248983]
MLKKVGALAAITAGMLLMGSPAFAGEPGSDDIDRVVGSARDIDHTDQVGLVNIDDSEILDQINICNIEVIQLVNVEIPIVPIDSYNCENTEVEVEIEDHHHHGHHHHWGHH